MKKKALCVLIALAMILGMTGCMYFDVQTTIKEDCSGSLVAKFGYEDDFFDTIKDSGEDYSAYVKEVIDGKTYYVMTTTSEFKDINELNALMNDVAPEDESISTGDMTVSFEQSGNDVIMTVFYPASEKDETAGTDAETEAMTEEFMGSMVMAMSFSFPEAAAKTKGPEGYATVEGNKVTLDLIKLEEAGQDITLEFKAALKIELPTEKPEENLPAEKDIPFSDVKDSDWFKAAVKYCFENKVMSGVSADKFAPKNLVTREQLATMLYNIAKADGKGFEADWLFKLDFTDAGEISAWADEAMHWCVMNGIMSGKSAEKLDPKGLVTREQLATMIYNYEKKINDGGFKGEWMFLLDNPDAAKVSAWADEAMHWAVMNKVVGGKTGGMLDPQGSATRAEIAQMFANYMGIEE